MRFYIQNEGQKKLLTAETYQELQTQATQMFNLSSVTAQLFFIDPTDQSEITISSEEDFKEILAEIVDLKTSGIVSKPVIKVVDSKKQ